MTLAQEDIDLIHKMIKQSISETPEMGHANVRYELDLRERTIRVEEEFKHQRELMMTGFAQMEKRFEQIDKRFEQVDKRFEQMDKRFEQAQEESNRRFEQVDKQLEKMGQSIMDIHEEIKHQMRWSFGILIGIGGLVLGILKLTS